MNDMARSVLKFIGYLFALLVVSFTGYQTWSLLYGVSTNPIVSGLGLVLFEGSMIYWWFFFRVEAEGLLQMGLSLLVAIFGLVLVGGATALHLGAVEATVLGTETPARLVTVAAVINLVAKFLMPLVHPEIMKVTYKKALTGKVLTQTFMQFETKVKDIAGQLAEEVAEDWKEDVRQEILSLHMSRPRVLLPGERHSHPVGEEIVIPAAATAVSPPVASGPGAEIQPAAVARPDAVREVRKDTAATAAPATSRHTDVGVDGRPFGST